VMAAWGDTDEIDGTDGEQPRFSNVSFNIVHEMGLYEKQSSPWFQAKSCQTTLMGNIFFNGPRALININDGFGGGNEITQNLLFNANRETTDHGPFNSWDRIPFLTDTVDPNNPSVVPLYNDIHHNFMIANYGSNMCIDNDDGSSWYLNHDNFEVYGGHKSDFGGHDKFTYNSIQAYAQDYAEGLCGEFNAEVSGYVDGFFDNRCVQGVNTPYLIFDECNSTDIDPSVLPVVHSNQVFNPSGSGSITCGSTTISEGQWQKMGFDPSTNFTTLPTNGEILNWASDLLGFPL